MPAIACVNLINIILSERSQSLKKKTHIVFFYLCELSKKSIYRDHMDYRLPDADGGNGMWL